jgi:hypothetical protein
LKKKTKIAKKQQKPKRIYVLDIFALFLAFSALSKKEFKFLKVF